MKTTFLIACFTTFIFTSCTKNNSDNTIPATDSYTNANAGSSWNYHTVDSSGTIPKNSDYTLTSSTQDTIINNKKYHIYNVSSGGNQYMNLTANNYYQYDSVPVTGGEKIERLYLTDNLAVNKSWSQAFTLNNIPNSPVPIPLTVSNTVVEKGISRMVNGVNYSNVIHISTSLSSSLVPAAALTSAIDSYYAPNYGLIDSKTIVHLNYLGITENANTSTQLMTANLK
ncbi:MAG: hypothetical protein ABI359_13610 [Ginsengibacter sp.]